MAQNEVLHLECYPSDAGEGLEDVWLSTGSDHEPMLIATAVPARAAYRANKAIANAIRLLREFEPGHYPDPNNDVHVGRGMRDVGREFGSQPRQTYANGDRVQAHHEQFPPGTGTQVHESLPLAE